MLRRVLQVSVAAAVVTGAVIILIREAESLPPLANVSIPSLLAVWGASFVFLLGQGLLIRETLLPHGLKLRLVEWFGTLMITLLGNYVIPFAGIGARARYLQRVHALAYRDFASALATMYASQVFVFSLGGLVATAVGPLPPDELLTLFLIGTALGPPLVIGLGPHLPWLGRVKIVGDVLASWRHLRTHPLWIARMLAGAAVMYTGACGMFYFAYEAFHLGAPSCAAVLGASAANILAFVKIAPAALGTFDAAILYVIKLYGLAASAAVLVAAVARLGQILWFAPLAPVFWMLLGRDTLRGAREVAQPDSDLAEGRAFD